MSEKIVSSYKEPYNTLGEIIDLILTIIESSKSFRNKIEDTYNLVELAFLKRLLSAIMGLEHDALMLKEDFIQIQKSTTKHHTNELIQNVQ